MKRPISCIASVTRNVQQYAACICLLLLAGLLTPGSKAVAQGLNFPVREQSVRIKGPDLSGTATNILRVSNDARGQMLAHSDFGTYVKYKSNNTLVKFGIDYEAKYAPTSPAIYMLSYRIEGCKSMTDSIYSFSETDTMVIAYNPDSLTAFQDMQVRLYPKLYQAKLTLLGFFDMTSGTPAPLTLPLPLQNQNLYVELSMQYQTYTKFPYLPSDMNLLLGGSYDAGRQMLNTSWSLATSVPYVTLLQPQQYQLEWTYADNYAADGTELSSSAVHYSFKHNATRVLTDNSNYGIPVIYPRGYIIYRVRMMRVDSNLYKYPIYGPWTGPDEGVIGRGGAGVYKITTPHTGDSLNWNYTISFAEGGKYKHVVSYFDGMLKNRQTLTRFNTDSSLVLATENIYDYEGRPSITTLPTVVHTPAMSYLRGVSTSSVTGLPYAPADFDVKPAACPEDIHIPAFATTSLANRYYSTLNTDTLSGLQKFVPQAEGFPFVHSVLTPGFSDRVDQQGGAGPTLQVGQGHETKNEYVGGDQADLNQLFGINAGVSSFYTKTVTKDPNGQYSMLVKDYRGKQIVTSLIGASVDTSRHAIIFNDEVPTDSTSKFRENKLASDEANKADGNTKTYNGSFYMDFAALTNIRYEYDFQPYPVCTDPFLGLTVQGSYDYKVTDDCGVERLHRSGIIGTTGVTTVASPPPATSSDMVSLAKGKYTVDKVLTLNVDDANAAVDSFFNYQPNCLKTENDFIKEAIDRTTYPCPAPDPCGDLAKSMMEELFTNAKYGKYSRSGGVVFGLTPSIYDKPQDLPGHPGRYRYQSDCVIAALDSLVITRYGRTYRNIGELPVDTFMMLYTGANLYKIAAVLLPLHPEYCRLQACFVDTFETMFKALPDAATAIQYHLFSLDDIIARDKQLTDKMHAFPVSMVSPADSLQRILSTGARMDTAAAELAFCSSDDGLSYDDAHRIFHSDIVGLNFPNSQVRDLYFARLRLFYLDTRAKYKSIVQTAGGNACLPCDTFERMKLINPPLVPVIYTTSGGFAAGPGSLSGMFTDTLSTTLSGILGGGGPGGYSDTAWLRKMEDSASALVIRADTMRSRVAVDSIMARLVNCYYKNPSGSYRLHDTLMALVANGTVHNGVFLPDQIRSAIIKAGLNINDLCHPYLQNYDFYDDNGSGRSNCSAPELYTAARNFFNSTSIAAALSAATATPTFTVMSGWDNTNLFAAKIQAQLTGSITIVHMKSQYRASDSTYLLSFFYPASLDTVTITLRSPAIFRYGLSSYGLFQPTSGGTVTVSNVACYFEDPAAAAEGYIGRYMFRLSVTRDDVSGGTTYHSTASVKAWNNRIYMNEEGSSDIANSVPFTQFRAEFKRFADTMSLYGGYAADHPLFFRSLTNYMNYNLKRYFPQNQYERFLQSSGLSDSMIIPAYGGYIRIQFPVGAYANFKDFAAAIATNLGFTLKASLDVFHGSIEQVIIDNTTISYVKFASFLEQAAGITSYIKSRNPMYAGSLYLPVTVNPADIADGTSLTLAYNYDFDIKPGYYSDYTMPCILYTVSSSSAPDQLTRDIARLERNLLSKGGVYYIWDPNVYTTINQDYTNPRKQALLHYIYAMQSLPTGKVLDSMQTLYLQSNISAFSGSDLKYGDASNPSKFTDLNYSDVTNRFPGFDTMTRILGYMGAQRGSNRIFTPAGTSTYPVTAGVPGGALYNAYRCGDGLYWYRYFGAKKQLYSIYIRVPAYIPEAVHPNLQLLGFIPAVGDSATRNVTVLLREVGKTDTIRATGSANFDIGWSETLIDVLLGNEAAQPQDNEPLSGQPGAAPNCEQQLLANNIVEGKVNYVNYITKTKEDLKAAFAAYLMNQVREKLWIEYVNMRFGTTLYSYDLAGNLIRTVPPEGVHRLDTTAALMVDSLRDHDIMIPGGLPLHNKDTRTEYNTFNQPTRETTPDAGTKSMYYDLKGNVLLSQNAKQARTGLCTYFLYDGQNRLEETGEVQWVYCPYFDPVPLYFHEASGILIRTSQPYNCACANELDSVWEYCMPSTSFYNDSMFNAQIRAKPRTQVVYTYYDGAFIGLDSNRGMSAQTNLRGRIGANMYYESLGPGMPDRSYDHATHYSYDAAGNISTLTQDFPQLAGMKQRFKRIDYEYDLYSGKLNMIAYNRGYADQFYQRYTYDADNRLLTAETSHDALIWKQDAAYSYYQHGPLARTELGHHVQGMDYAYTLQGWLKGINGDRGDTLLDMGGDGKRAASLVSQDLYATTIDYFSGDYKPIGRTQFSIVPGTNKNLYNGNIARISNDVAPFGGLTTAYTYDQMNRIRRARYATTNAPSLSYGTHYASDYKYDMNGNLQSLTRREGLGVLMDSLKYVYLNGMDNNKLTNVQDYSSFSQPGVEDLKPYVSMQGNRLEYNENGEVTRDLTSNTDSIGWNIYGKSTEIRNTGSGLQLHFGYDALGHRTYKMRTESSDTAKHQYGTFYVREASGNILAEYNTEVDTKPGDVIRFIEGTRFSWPSGGGTTLPRTWFDGLYTLGYLTDPVFVSAITSVAGTTSFYPAGHYLVADPALTQQFVLSGPDVLPALAAYSKVSGEYPVGDALAEALPMSAQQLLWDLSLPLFGNPDPVLLGHSLEQLAQTIPDIYINFAQSNQITINTPGDSVLVAQLMLNTAQQNSAYFPNAISNYYFNNVPAPPAIHDWLNAISSDSLYLTGPGSGFYTVVNFTGTLSDNLWQYAAQAATTRANIKGTTVEQEGLYGFGNWWSDALSRVQSLSNGQQLQLLDYYNDPVTFMLGFTDVHGFSVVDATLASLPSFDVFHFGDVILGIGWDTLPPIVLPWRPRDVVNRQEIRLGNHHLYGSSRIGISNYWPQQYRSLWDNRSGEIDTVSLAAARPWYSRDYNELIKTDSIGYYGNGLDAINSEQHIIGQKQYELTNHLGNVQVTLSDKRAPKLLQSQLQYYNAGIVAAYDYYPYGQLMPGRYVADTSLQCASVTLTQRVERTANTQLNPMLGVAILGSTGLAPGSSGPVLWGCGSGNPPAGSSPARVMGQTGGVSYTLSVTAGKTINVYTGISYICGAMVRVVLSEDRLGVSTMLDSRTTGVPGSLTFTITPLTSTVTVNMSLMSSLMTPPIGGLFMVECIGYDKFSYADETSIVDICNRVPDKYEFGYNGQMKMNEVAGTGNWNTAEFWEYQTRTAHRENPDPIRIPSQSPFAVFDANPILKNDVNGDAPGDYYSQSGTKIGTDGNDDDKVYIVPQKSDVKKIEKASKENKSVELKDVSSAIELPTKASRRESAKAFDEDEKDPYREVGGVIGLTADGTEKVVWAKPGAHANPTVDNEATIDVFDAQDNDLLSSIVTFKTTFHLHPTGNRERPMLGDVITFDRDERNFSTNPSERDKTLSTNRLSSGLVQKYELVMSGATKTVKFYNDKGIIATFPLDAWKNAGKK